MQASRTVKYIRLASVIRITLIADESAFDEYYKAYSIAVMGGNERPELLYGGKSKPGVLWVWSRADYLVVMPASALAKLSTSALVLRRKLHR